jgi:predicted RNase H-like HicB family nuclease
MVHPAQLQNSSLALSDHLMHLKPAKGQLDDGESQLFCHPGTPGERRIYRACPGPSGGGDEGDTEQEALANAQEAIRAILDYRRDHGIAIPEDAPPEIRRVTVAA